MTQFSTTLHSINSVYFKFPRCASEPNSSLKLLSVVFFSSNSTINSPFFISHIYPPSQDVLAGGFQGGSVPTVPLTHATTSELPFLFESTTLLFLSWPSELLNRGWMMLNPLVHNKLPKYRDSHRHTRPMFGADLVGRWGGEILLPHHPLTINKARK